MTTLDTMRVGLKTLAANLGGLDAYWEDQQRPYINPSTRAALLLSLGPSNPIGRDEIRSDWDASRDHAEWQDTAVGIRRLPWRIKCYGFEETDAKVAQFYLERIRTRLRWMSTVRALNALSLSRANTGQVTDLSVPVDDRMTSIAFLDIGLNAVFQETDVDHGYTYIAEFHGTGDFGSGPFPYSEDIGS